MLKQQIKQNVANMRPIANNPIHREGIFLIAHLWYGLVKKSVRWLVIRYWVAAQPVTNNPITSNSPLDIFPALFIIPHTTIHIPNTLSGTSKDFIGSRECGRC